MSSIVDRENEHLGKIGAGIDFFAVASISLLESTQWILDAGNAYSGVRKEEYLIKEVVLHAEME